MRVLSSLLVVLLVFATLPLQAQGDHILSGVTRVRAIVDVSWDERANGAGQSEEAFRETLTARFTFELRKLGLVVSDEQSQVLACRVTFTAQPPWMAMSVSVQFSEPMKRPQRDGVYLAVPWEMNRVGLGSTSTFLSAGASGAADAQGLWCAETFGNAWLAANPPRP